MLASAKGLNLTQQVLLSAEPSHPSPVPSLTKHFNAGVLLKGEGDDDVTKTEGEDSNFLWF